MGDQHPLNDVEAVFLGALLARRNALAETIHEYQVSLGKIDAAIRAATPEVGTYQVGDTKVLRQLNRTFDKEGALKWMKESGVDVSSVASPAWELDRVKFATKFPEVAEQFWVIREPKLVIK